MKRKEMPEYTVWVTMRERCNNPNCKGYKNYGGRGIRVCDEWDDFFKFMEDMGPRPEGYSIDRVDNEKGYSKGNCKWSSREDQNLNKRTTIKVDFDGEKIPLVIACRRIGMSYLRARRNLKAGKDWKDTSNKRKPVFVLHEGKMISAKEAGEITGFHKTTIVTRFNNGEKNIMASHNLRRGERVKTCKLNEIVVSKIKKQIADGVSLKQIASEFGVDPAMISKIKHGKTWKWVV